MNKKYWNRFILLFAGLLMGLIANLIYRNNMCQPKILHIVRDTVITLKVDKLREGAQQGNIEDYGYLKQYFRKKGYPEEILYYSMLMTDRYQYYLTSNDVCNSSETIFKKYKLGSFDEDTQKLYLYYQEKSASSLKKKH